MPRNCPLILTDVRAQTLAIAREACGQRARCWNEAGGLPSREIRSKSDGPVSCGRREGRQLQQTTATVELIFRKAKGEYNSGP
jgi:hypothetical protein